LPFIIRITLFIAEMKIILDYQIDGNVGIHEATIDAAYEIDLIERPFVGRPRTGANRTRFNNFHTKSLER